MVLTKNVLLEVAVASVERARAVERSGAHRLELCTLLELGGLTPALDLVRQVRAAVSLPIHVLVRPRSGNFVYTAEEFAQMKFAIRTLRAENVQGIATGVLHANATVDIARTRELAAFAAPLPVTFHRAFDEAPNLSQALENVVATGAKRILTSGGAPSVADATETIRQLITQAANRITILPGAGLHAGNIASVVRLPGVHELHTGLGTVLPYNDPDLAKFESALRNLLASL